MKCKYDGITHDAGTSWEKAGEPVKDGGDGETEGRREHHDRELTRSRERESYLKRKQDDERLTVREGH